MGILFSLDAVKPTIQQALDDLITELGKDCLLVYPPKWVNCSNCLSSSFGNKSSSSWKSGGPLPFPAGTVCPLCNGSNKVSQEQTESVRMLCAWEPKAFFEPLPQVDVRVPYGVIQTKSYLSDAPKIMRADHAVFQTPTTNILRSTYELAGEPVDVSNIIQGRYCVATWKRVL